MGILNKLGDSRRYSGIFSDNGIDDIAAVDAVINDDSDEDEETFKTFLWETMDNYSGPKELLSVDSGPRNEAENTVLAENTWFLCFQSEFSMHHGSLQTWVFSYS